MGLRNKRIVASLVLTAAVMLGFAACDKQAEEDEPAAAVKRNVKPEADQETVVIETDFGRMVIELYPNVAPQMVERFKTLVRSGFYDGTLFHRIDPDLGIIQGGDPLSKDGDPQNDGTGGSDFPNVPAEFSDIPYARGIVGAARSGSPNSANSQFFVTLIRQPAFDEKYTVFGRVIEGVDTAGIISNAQVQAGTERPRDPIYLKRATLQPRTGK